MSEAGEIEHHSRPNAREKLNCPRSPAKYTHHSFYYSTPSALMLICDLTSCLFLSFSSNEPKPGRGQFPVLSCRGESGGGSERESHVRHRLPLEEPSRPPKGKQQQQQQQQTNNKNVYLKMFYIIIDIVLCNI